MEQALALPLQQLTSSRVAYGLAPLAAAAGFRSQLPVLEGMFLIMATTCTRPLSIPRVSAPGRLPEVWTSLLTIRFPCSSMARALLTRLRRQEVSVVMAIAPAANPAAPATLAACTTSPDSIMGLTRCISLLSRPVRPLKVWTSLFQLLPFLSPAPY